MPVRPSSQAQRDAVRRHDTEKVERVTIRLPKGTRSFIEPTGMSTNAFVVAAVTEKIEREKNKSVSLQIPQEELDLYAQAADERGMTLEEMILEALKVFIKEY